MPKLLVVSGPSGGGKTTIAREILLRHGEQITFSVSATTRQQRTTEVHGRDYFFITQEAFEQLIRQNELAEWEQIYGDYYGSLKSEIRRAFESGKSILFDVDVKGALSIKKAYPRDSVLIFIKPPDVETLAQRLTERKTESEAVIARRMERVAMELDAAKEFDFIIVNNTLRNAVDAADAIITQAIAATA